MSKDGILESRRNIVEEEYFAKKNREALEKLTNSVVTSKRPCPITEEDLQPEAFHGVIVYKSASNKGVWIEANDLQNLLESNQDQHHKKWNLNFFKQLAEETKSLHKHGALQVAELDEGVRLSPVSRKAMEKIDVAGVILDRCPSTGGLWFDSGELKQFMEKIVTLKDDNLLSSFIGSLFKTIGYVS